MEQVRIITDITANLTPEFIAQHHVTTLPIRIRFGDEILRINRKKDSEKLFGLMASGPAKPAQAFIPARTFQDAFSRLSQETGEILVILSSRKLIQAYEQAQSAARPFLGRCRITVVDSVTASWGLQLMVKAAVEAADDGHPLDEIVRRVRGISPHIYFVFFVERLDYLERGGRIGQAQALLGTMLRIKPLLLMEDGDIVPLEKVRTRIMAIEKLTDFVVEFASIQHVVILASPTDGDMEEMVADLQAHLKMALPERAFPVLDYGPLLASHLGPVALGVVVYEGL